MQSFFCAQASRQSGEDLIGEARNLSTYVLIEQPQPWQEKILDTKGISEYLKPFAEELAEAEYPVRMLLIDSKYLRTDYRRIIVLKRQKGFSQGYHRQEIQISDLAEIVPALKDCLFNAEPFQDDSLLSQTRDILVCTHGNYDKCCGKYGKAFYNQALEIVESLSLQEQVRVWQASHIGGHRFAPTAIDFPDGRYYGRLDPESFTAILTRTGDLNCIAKTYRGWGVLPASVQIVERELILNNGWEWFNYGVKSEVLEANEEKSYFRCQLQVKKEDHSLETYEAEVVEDPTKDLYIQGSCRKDSKSKSPQYKVQSLLKQ